MTPWLLALIANGVKIVLNLIKGEKVSVLLFTPPPSSRLFGPTVIYGLVISDSDVNVDFIVMWNGNIMHPRTSLIYFYL